jgi:VWFA-related protein
MRSVLLSAIVVVGVSMPGRVSIGQEAGPGATAEIVRLDAVVTDAQGHLVRDLRASDFELLEDGKARPLTQFLFVGGRGPTPPVAAEVPSVPRSAETAATAGPGRDVVIFVDDLHIARRNFDFMKEALRQFVSGFLGPEDRVAIVTSAGPGGVRELTRDRTVLGAAIDGLAFRQAVVAPARGSQMTPAQAELILRGDPSALQLATRLVMDEPGSVLSGGPRAALEGAGGYTPASVVDTKDRAGAQEALRQARTILAEDLHFSEITLVRVEDVLRSLAALPGRKLCLLVSDGFLVGTGTSDEQTRHLRAVVDAATRCGAVVYALDAHGRTTTGGDTAAAGIPAPPGLRERVERLSAREFRDTLSRLANDTGGFLVQGGTNEIATGLRRMLEDNEAYYLMAYEPASSKRDGRFRRIELRMPGRPDLTVRTRAGYFAPDDRKGAPKRGERASMPLALGDAEARAALGAAVPANGIPVGLTVDYLDLPPAGSQAIVRARVEVADLPWREAEGRRRADLDIVGGVFDASGALVGPPFTRHVSLDLTPAEQERARQSGLQFQQRVPAAPGRDDVRLVVLDANLAPLGGASETVEIPDLAKKKLTLSSVFLSSTTATPGAAPGDAGAGETLRDAQARRLFKRGESLYFQVYVYNAVSDESGKSDVVLQAQIRSAGKLVAASKPQPVTFHEKDGVPLPQSNGMSLEGFDPGYYDLRVVVVDRRVGVTAFRDVDFTVQ